MGGATSLRIRLFHPLLTLGEVFFRLSRILAQLCLSEAKECSTLFLQISQSCSRFGTRATGAGFVGVRTRTAGFIHFAVLTATRKVTAGISAVTRMSTALGVVSGIPSSRGSGAWCTVGITRVCIARAVSRTNEGLDGIRLWRGPLCRPRSGVAMAAGGQFPSSRITRIFRVSAVSPCVAVSAFISVPFSTIAPTCVFREHLGQLIEGVFAWALGRGGTHYTPTRLGAFRRAGVGVPWTLPFHRFAVG